MFLVFLCAYCLCNINVNDLPYLPSIGKVRNGYDLVKGNPKNTESDPGLTHQIFDFTKFVPTPDHRYLIPDQYTADISPDCSYNSEADVIESTTDYQKSLETDVSADFSGWGFAFSASADYQKVEQMTTKSSTRIVTTKAMCTYYRLSLQYKYQKLNLSSTFNEAVRELSRDVNSTSKYSDFIDYFGTHFISKGIFGSKFFIRSGFTDTAWTKFQSSGLDVQASASASFTVWSAGGSVSSNTTMHRAETFNEDRSFNNQLYQGSLPPQTGKWEDWAKDSQASPTVVQYELKQIDGLINSFNFPDIESNILLMILENLGNSLSSYCSEVPKCHLPINPKIQSCVEYKEKGYNVDGYYSVFYQGNEKKPYQIFCRNMEKDLPPLGYINLPEKNLYYRRSTVNCGIVDSFCPDFIGIDEMTLEIRKSDTWGDMGCSKKSTPTQLFGTSYVGSSCLLCLQRNTFTLKGTKFAFDDSQTSYTSFGGFEFVDEYKQAVRVWPVKPKPCKSREVYYGFSKLKYIAISK